MSVHAARRDAHLGSGAAPIAERIELWTDHGHPLKAISSALHMLLAIERTN